MNDFIKRLLADRHKKLKIILLDDSSPGSDKSYSFKPDRLIKSWIASSVILIIITALIFMLTPLGSLLYSTEEVEIKNQLGTINQRIEALQDSLNVRDNQLFEIKKVIRTNTDTTLSQDEKLRRALDTENTYENSSSDVFLFTSILDNIDENEIFNSNVLNSAMSFPSAFPVKGTNTRGYKPEEGHFGIDIAAKNNEPVAALADGTLITAAWSLEYGYVISVQHQNGYVSVYKHCSKVYKQEGDPIKKGDILGLVGDVGIASSGVHLHLELWKDGIAQNPLLYLIQ